MKVRGSPGHAKHRPEMRFALLKLAVLAESALMSCSQLAALSRLVY